MMKFKRPRSPKFLTENWEKWGQLYEKSESDFTWKIEKINVRSEILPILRKATKNHCSYCDGYPTESLLGETIDHFKPKSNYPLEAYKWENLFLCCYICQKRINKYEDILLKPDEIEYEFRKYFRYKTKTGELEPNFEALLTDQKRAIYTIKIFKLNDFNRPKARKEFFRKFARDSNPIIDKYPFRFIFTQ